MSTERSSADTTHMDEVSNEDGLSAKEVADFIAEFDSAGKTPLVMHIVGSVPVDASALLPSQVRASVLKRTKGRVPTGFQCVPQTLRFYHSDSHTCEKDPALGAGIFHMYASQKGGKPVKFARS